MRKSTLRMLVMRLPVDPDQEAGSPAGKLALAARTALVAIGGSAGALLRAAVETVIPHSAGWPSTTLAVNLSGSAMLALLLVVLEERFPAARAPRPLIGTGLLGGYTTFSTFAVGVVGLVRHGHAGIALGYVGLSIFGALLAALAGLVLGRALYRLSEPDRWMRRVRHARVLETAEEYR